LTCSTICNSGMSSGREDQTISLPASHPRRLMPISYSVEHPAELLAFLLASRSGTKKAKVRQWLKHGAVLVNGQPITQFNHPLRPGDRVSISTGGESRALGLLPRGLQIVCEDASLIVIEKPANLLSVGSDTEREKTAHAFLMSYVKAGQPQSRNRVWIVHRLDRETSGLMVFAKTETAKRELQANWKLADKRYLAVVEGCPPAAAGVLRTHLDESRVFKVHAAAPSLRSRLAITHYQVIKQTAACTLIELKLETGRRNQIRVQLAEAGCPIIGDEKYGAMTNPAGRLGLHASSLQFPHPISGTLCQFESALPEQLARLV
jgi:23S rRNA pseudouridine1911/1915/1917 synthase